MHWFEEKIISDLQNGNSIFKNCKWTLASELSLWKCFDGIVIKIILIQLNSEIIKANKMSFVLTMCLTHWQGGKVVIFSALDYFSNIRMRFSVQMNWIFIQWKRKISLSFLNLKNNQILFSYYRHPHTFIKSPSIFLYNRLLFVALFLFNLYRLTEDPLWWGEVKSNLDVSMMRKAKLRFFWDFEMWILLIM